MGGGASTSVDEWRGTDQELAELMMPLYYVRNVVVTEDDISKASSGWNMILEGRAESFIEYRNSLSNGSESSIEWFSNVFYGRLFDVNPSSRKLFKENASTQARVLQAIISTALSQLHDPTTFGKTMTQLAHVHVKRGVKAVQFGIAGDVLLWSLAHSLRSVWTDDMRQSWVKLYSGMLKALVPVAIGDERINYRKSKRNEKISRFSEEPRASIHGAIIHKADSSL